MKEGQRVLVLRYGKNIVPNCIEKHIEVVEKYGFCWFGKIGKSPSKTNIKAVLDEEHPMIILYAKGSAYQAELLGISYEKPTEAYPEYYEEYLYKQMLYPSAYFKITNIKRIDVGRLTEYRILSSGNDLLSTLQGSMNSFFVCCYGKAISKPVVKEKKVLEDKTASKNPFDCKYKKDGICSNSRCISYKYQCERPSTCLKRK